MLDLVKYQLTGQYVADITLRNAFAIYGGFRYLLRAHSIALNVSAEGNQ
jgi:hypothetical protein